MAATTHILFVEDVELDAQLVMHRLAEAGIEADSQRVHDEAGLRRALEERQWGLAIVDFNLPGYSGLEALRTIVREAPDTPVITISGVIDEETAVGTMSAGAVDYILKDNLARLAPAVERALAGAESRRALRQSVEEARVMQFALDHASFAVAMILEDGTVTYANDSMLRLTGATREAFVGGKVWDLDPEETPADYARLWAAVRERGVATVERTTRDPSGLEHVLEITMNPLERPDSPAVIAYTHDVTQSRAATAALRESEDQFEAFARHLPGYLAIHDDARRYVYVNDHPLQEGDVPPPEWLGKTPSELWPSEDAEIEEGALEMALRGEVVDILEEWHGPRAVEHLHSLYFPIRREGQAPLAGSVSIDVSPVMEAQAEARETAERLRQTLEGTVLAMSHVVETRDPYTAGHERRVADLVIAIASEMGLSGEDLEGVRVAALIHDIGKIAVPAEILTRPGRLSQDEFRLIMQHPEAGSDIIAGINFGRPVAEMIRQHHERLDGSGYPAGLSGEQIVLEARILAVADVVEAMASHRPYRPSRGLPAALDEIRDGAGTRYDGAVSRACIAVFEQRGFSFTT